MLLNAIQMPMFSNEMTWDESTVNVEEWKNRIGKVYQQSKTQPQDRYGTNLKVVYWATGNSLQ